MWKYGQDVLPQPSFLTGITSSNASLLPCKKYHLLRHKCATVLYNLDGFMNPTPCFRLKDSSSSTGELITVTGMNESPVYQPTCNQAVDYIKPSAGNGVRFRRRSVDLDRHARASGGRSLNRSVRRMRSKLRLAGFLFVSVCFCCETADGTDVFRTRVSV